MSQAVDAAIYALLNGNASLASQSVTGIFRNRAPEGQSMPYVVFFQSGGSYQYTMTERAFHSEMYVVKAVDQGEDQERAQAIDSACDALLTDGAIAPAGSASTYCRRIGDIEYQEDQEPGNIYQHDGGTYRISRALT